MTATVLAGYVEEYLKAGWHPFPLPSRQKHPPPHGATGRSGTDLTQDEVTGRLRDNSNIGIRMPDNVIGIDVDAYGTKTGDITMQWLEYGPPGEEEDALGWLPGTFKLTSREDGVSGISFYRVPPGLLWEGQAGQDVEIIQRAHRYAVAAPSMHPTGREYRWYDSKGVPSGVPRVSDLTELPEKWVEYLKKSRSHRPSTGVRSEAGNDEVKRTLSDFAEGPACSCVRETGDKALRAARREFGSAHDNLLPLVLNLVRQGMGGCKGAGVALREALDAYKVLGAGRDDDFLRMVAGAIPMAKSDVWTCRDAAGTAYSAWTAPGTSDAREGSASSGGGTTADPPPNPYAYVTWDKAFWNPPDPVWFIPKMLIEGQVGTIYSKGGLGKSLLLQDVAAGLTVRGRVFGEPVEKQSVLYIDRENSSRGLMKRLKSMGFGGKDISLLHYSLLGTWPPLDTPVGGLKLLEEVIRLNAKLVVIDTMSKIVDGDENANDTWRGLHMHSMVNLKRAGVTVLQLDHTGKDVEKGQRGGSSKHDNADVVWHLDVIGDYVVMNKKKDRDGDYDETLYIERCETPRLEHVFASSVTAAAAVAHLSIEAQVNEAVAILDGLNVPTATGRDKARAKIKEAYGDTYKVANDVLSAAIKKRKEQAS